MPRFLIQVPHEPEQMACLRTIEIFLKTGSHFLTHADWGCMDGDHTAWIIVETDTKDQARAVLPAAFRAQAKIVALHKFTMEQLASQH